MEPQFNPYASPAIAEDRLFKDVQLDGAQKPASQGLRFANSLLDNIIIQAISYPAGYVFGMVWGSSIVASGRQPTQDDLFGLQVMGFFLGLAISFTYFSLTEILFQRSLAKFVTGTKVVSENGSRPSVGQILGRTLSRYIPFEAFSFFGGQGYPVGWHDSLSGTRVVKA